MLTAKLDEVGRPAWVLLTIIAFWTAWPLGLALLAFLLGSGRLGGRLNGPWGSLRCDMPGSRFNVRNDNRTEARADARPGRGWRFPGSVPSSGNEAFDQYRSETLRRLEEEQREFQEYLERLRRARDKAEFDQFMAERRGRPGNGDGKDASENAA